MVAQIFVDVEHLAVDQPYDYHVPSHLEAVIEIGQRVIIPFGTRKITGIVIELKTTSAHNQLKTIIDIVDPVPLFSDELLHLAKQLAFEHITPRMRYLNAMLPNALRMKYKKTLRVKQLNNLPKTLQSYFTSADTIVFDEKLKSHYKSIKEAIKNNDIDLDMELKQTQTVLKIPVVKLEKDTTVRGEKQQAIIDYLKERNGVERKILLQATNASSTSLKALENKGIVRILAKETYREIQSIGDIKDKTITLNKDQQSVYNTIVEHLHEAKTFLLHGVTSSGKTEIYLNVVEKVLTQGKTAIIMVPEISLTPALTARFKARFKAQVAVYHSRLSIGERYDEWRRIKTGKAKILIGARSSVFAPLENIGIIILDEEHSDAYRQEENPKYDAKKIALTRAKHHNIPVVLGSATPSVESYYRALKNDYHLLTLKKRAEQSTLPTVAIIDMKKEFIEGNTSVFSKSLYAAMQKRFEKNEQTLLLINRRGHANFVLCRQCGHTIECDDCDVSMTYHHKKQQLKCHYCEATKPMPKTCPKCHSEHIRYMGLGSERVELELQKAFPTAKIYRMDRDTTQVKDGHAKLLHAFERDGDFLVGTQMISKGLDFDKVTLVGVLSADMALFVPDYYAKEETFSLLTQMAGRSGRRTIQGEVIIQAYRSDHPVLEDVKKHDYEHFYHEEIALRKKADIAPFKTMMALTITHRYQNTVFKTTANLVKKLKNTLPKSVRIIGPITPKYVRIQGKYRMHILLKTDTVTPVLKHLNPLVTSMITKDLTISLDYHPSMF